MFLQVFAESRKNKLGEQRHCWGEIKNSLSSPPHAQGPDSFIFFRKELWMEQKERRTEKRQVWSCRLSPGTLCCIVENSRSFRRDSSLGLEMHPRPGGVCIWNVLWSLLPWVPLLNCHFTNQTSWRHHSPLRRARGRARSSPEGFVFFLGHCPLLLFKPPLCSHLSSSQTYTHINTTVPEMCSEIETHRDTERNKMTHIYRKTWRQRHIGTETYIKTERGRERHTHRDRQREYAAYLFLCPFPCLSAQMVLTFRVRGPCLHLFKSHNFLIVWACCILRTPLFLWPSSLSGRSVWAALDLHPPPKLSRSWEAVVELLNWERQGPHSQELGQAPSRHPGKGRGSSQIENQEAPREGKQNGGTDIT